MRRIYGMKTKQYTFTEIELYVLRAALDAYYFDVVKNSKPAISPSVIAMRKATKPLLDQIKQDVSVM